MRLAAVLLAASFLFGSYAFSEETSNQDSVGQPTDEKLDASSSLDEVLVTAKRSEASVFDVPYTAQVISGREIRERRMVRTLVDVFSEEPSIMVQKTSHGQGSPYMRGFTGFRALFLIDGIRLNNSVFRDGPNQYWNTIDPLTIGRLEVVKGPSSVLYGSDAIGGTVNAVTRSRSSYEDGFNLTRRVYYRHASADDSNVGRLELSGNQDGKLGFVVGTSLKDFDDVTGGRNVGLQPKTGYQEIDGDVKVEYFVNPDSKFVFGFQHVDQDDVWRTHKTIYGISWEGTTIGNEKRRSLDQARDLVYVQYHDTGLGQLGKATFSLSYQLQQEDRYRIKSDDTSDRQGFDVGTVGLWSQFETTRSIGRISYGFEYYHDFVDSYATKYNADGSLNKKQIQGPVADDASYDLFGLFLQNEFPLFRDDLVATAGVRYTHVALDADRVEDPETKKRISLSDQWDNVVGSFRLQYYVNQEYSLFGGVSQGFRAPNLSDVTRLDTARSNEIETPSPGLDPEEFIAYEIGLKASRERFRGQASYFYTTISDMIIRYPTGDVIGGDNEVQKANVGDGYMHGFEVQSEYDLTDEWSVFGGAAWQEGRVDTYPTSAMVLEREWIDRLAPLTGRVGVRWEDSSGKYWAEAYSQMAADADKLSTRDQSDTQRIPPGGTPGYIIGTIRGGLKATENMTISAAVENITDEDYRIHGSGQNEPGTNFVVSLDYLF